MLTTLFTLYPAAYVLFAICLIAGGFALIYKDKFDNVLDYLTHLNQTFVEFICLNIEVSLMLLDVDDYNDHLCKLQTFRGYLSFNVFILMTQTPLKLDYKKHHEPIALSNPVEEEGIYHEPKYQVDPPIITDVRQLIIMRMNQYAYA